MESKEEAFGGGDKEGKFEKVMGRRKGSLGDGTKEGGLERVMET